MEEPRMKKLLTLKDIKEACNVGYSTVYRWRKNGTFPEPVGVGKLLWREDQIIEWMNRQSKPVAPAATTSAEWKRDKKAFEQRQAAATAALQRHATNR
jgi:predicted DNA-binding transcriptional regulator AlpA